MAEGVVSIALKQLTPAIAQEAKHIVAVETDLQKLQRMLKTIEKVLADAENKQFEDESIGGWLRELKEVAYNVEDVLDVWNTSIQKQQLEEVYDNTSIMWKTVRLFFTSFYDNTSILCKKECLFFTSFCDCFGKLAFRHGIASKIKETNENLDEIIKQKNLFNLNEIRRSDETHWKERSTTSYIDVSEVRGRDEDKNTLVNKLLSESTKGGKDLHVISLVGMGGIGKTTLAQSIYNHVDIVKCFDKSAWVCVSEPFDRFRVAKAIIQELRGQASNLTELQPLLKEIHDCITGKKFLLVLDDVWTEDRSDVDELLSCLKKGVAGSKILITTRKKEVASVFESDIISVKELSDNECWLLFSRLAFFESSIGDREKLENIGRKIVAKCKGLPLAVKTLGSLLRFKTTTEGWQSILESEMWELEFDKGPLPPLLLSYNDLPFMVKRCFLYCVVFPKDYMIDKDDLIKLWMANGYLDSKAKQAPEVTGNEYFNILANRSFFQEFSEEDGETTCKMHDITHDCAQYLTQNEFFAIEVNGREDQRELNARHMTVLGDHEISFLDICPRSEKLHSLLSFCFDHISISNALNQLTSLRVLKLREEESVVEIPKEIEKLILLRYLDVSKNEKLKEFPEAFRELYNLQTLNIRGCVSLTALPRGIGKLINLRHLMNRGCSGLSYMPKGIERLTNLRTLGEFVVSDGNHVGEASTLASLKSLKHLQGKLTIRGLGNVRDVSEAKEAQLHNNTKLTSLGLDFSKSNKEEEGARTAEDDELLLEALLPPPTNLQRLIILFYRGKIISQICLTSLAQLTYLGIVFCWNMELLPPLGIFPSLESLRFIGIERVKNVGGELLGIESGFATSSAAASSSPIIVFPKLTSLRFSDMDEWEEWDYGIAGKQEDIHIMPSLRLLEIRYCPKLKVLPDRLLHNTSLKELKIEWCPLLYSYLKKRGQDWPLNIHIPQISYYGLTNEEDRIPLHYKSVIDPKEHKFYFVKSDN